MSIAVDSECPCRVVIADNDQDIRLISGRGMNRCLKPIGVTKARTIQHHGEDRENPKKARFWLELEAHQTTPDFAIIKGKSDIWSELS